MRYAATLSLAFAAALAVESTCYARTATPARAWGGEPFNEEGAALELVLGSSPAPTASFSHREPGEGTGAEARIYLCHISHHPRDGLRRDQHACPLFIAVGQPSAASRRPGKFAGLPRST
jgi:hypothetical protein